MVQSQKNAKKRYVFLRMSDRNEPEVSIYRRCELWTLGIMHDLLDTDIVWDRSACPKFPRVCNQLPGA